MRILPETLICRGLQAFARGPYLSVFPEKYLRKKARRGAFNAHYPRRKSTMTFGER